MHIREGNYIYDSNIREVLTRNISSDGIEKRLEGLIDRLASVVELLHSKGFIKEDEIYDLAEVEKSERFDPEKVTYSIVRNGKKYDLQKTYLPVQTKHYWRMELKTETIHTGTLKQMENIKEELDKLRPYR